MRHLVEAQNKLAFNGLTDDKFIVMEDMTLETRDGDAKFLMGEEVILGAEGENLVVQDGRNSYIVEDCDIARELINNVACKEDFSGVQYQKLSFVEAKNMRIVTSDLIKAVADTNEIRSALKDAKKRKESLFEMKTSGVELPVIKNEHKVTEQVKMQKIFENKLVSKNAHLVEAIEIRETPAYAKDTLMLDTLRVMTEAAKADKDEMNSVDDFMNDAAALDATVDMDGEEGEMIAKKGETVVGVFDQKAGLGVIFKAGAFKDAKELKDAMKDAGIKLKDTVDLEKLIDGEKQEEVEAAIDEFNNSDKAEESCEKCKKVLVNCGMSDDMAESVLGCFK